MLHPGSEQLCGRTAWKSLEIKDDRQDSPHIHGLAITRGTAIRARPGFMIAGSNVSLGISSNVSPSSLTRILLARDTGWFNTSVETTGARCDLDHRQPDRADTAFYRQSGGGRNT